LCVGNISSSSPAAPLSDFPQTCPCVVLLIDPFSGGGGFCALSSGIRWATLSRTNHRWMCVFVLLAPHAKYHITYNGTRQKKLQLSGPVCVCVNSGSHANAHTTTHITRKRWPTYLLFGLFSVGRLVKVTVGLFLGPALGIR
jgi:hypothetical protein